MMKESWIDEVMKSKISMIASDGGEYSPTGHPRASGTFCKTIREYVNEKKLLNINTAIKKITLMPAKVLENIVPDMKLRGRIQKGSYADLVLFDLAKVKDNSTYSNGFVRSSGMDYVIVNGIILIANGKLKPKTFPGKGIKSAMKL